MITFIETDRMTLSARKRHGYSAKKIMLEFESAEDVDPKIFFNERGYSLPIVDDFTSSISAFIRERMKAISSPWPVDDRGLAPNWHPYTFYRVNMKRGTNKLQVEMELTTRVPSNLDKKLKPSHEDLFLLLDTKELSKILNEALLLRKVKAQEYSDAKTAEWVADSMIWEIKRKAKEASNYDDRLSKLEADYKACRVRETEVVKALLEDNTIKSEDGEFSDRVKELVFELIDSRLNHFSEL
jgi:hypothetical protein